MATYYFREKLADSRDPKLIKYQSGILQKAFPGSQVIQGNEPQDRKGGDFFVYSPDGIILSIVDAKHRFEGAKQYWKNNQPEFTLEEWSSIPSPNNPGKLGWSRDSNKICSHILYSFSEIKGTLIVPFTLLRLAYVKHRKYWLEEYKNGFQYNRGWTSQSLFVPSGVFCKAVEEILR